MTPHKLKLDFEKRFVIRNREIHEKRVGIMQRRRIKANIKFFPILNIGEVELLFAYSNFPPRTIVYLSPKKYPQRQNNTGRAEPDAIVVYLVKKFFFLSESRIISRLIIPRALLYLIYDVNGIMIIRVRYAHWIR